MEIWHRTNLPARPEFGKLLLYQITSVLSKKKRQLSESSWRLTLSCINIWTYGTICTNIVAIVDVYPYGNTVNTVNTVNHSQPTIQPPKPPNLLKLPKTRTVNTENNVKTYKLLIITIQMVQIMQLEPIFHVGTHWATPAIYSFCYKQKLIIFMSELTPNSPTKNVA